MSSAAAPTLIVVVAFAHYTLVAKQTLTATIAFVRLLSSIRASPQHGRADFRPPSQCSTVLECYTPRCETADVKNCGLPFWNSPLLSPTCFKKSFRPSGSAFSCDLEMWTIFSKHRTIRGLYL